jgi:hypothetical protein
MTDTTTRSAQGRSDLSAEVARGAGLGLAEAARRIPPSRRGKPVSPATLTRWIVKGVPGPDGRRVHLDAVRCGGRWLTSESALKRFLDALTPVVEGASSAQTPEPSQPHRLTQRTGADHAQQELERLGI